MHTVNHPFSNPEISGVFLFNGSSSPLKMALDEAKTYQVPPDLICFTFHVSQRAASLLFRAKREGIVGNITIYSENNHRNDLGWKRIAESLGIEVHHLNNHSKIIILQPSDITENPLSGFSTLSEFSEPQSVRPSDGLAAAMNRTQTIVYLTSRNLVPSNNTLDFVLRTEGKAAQSLATVILSAL